MVPGPLKLVAVGAAIFCAERGGELMYPQMTPWAWWSLSAMFLVIAFHRELLSWWRRKGSMLNVRQEAGEWRRTFGGVWTEFFGVMRTRRFWALLIPLLLYVVVTRGCMLLLETYGG